MTNLTCNFVNDDGFMCGNSNIGHSLHDAWIAVMVYSDGGGVAMNNSRYECKMQA